MSYDCKIVADSIAENGCRLTTFEVTYPLIIHAEVMTHRVFSRNVASNRAIPVKKLIASVEDNPFVPEKFPKNQAGMQSAEWLDGNLAEASRMTWLKARDHAVDCARELLDFDVHKQIANRLLAPWLWTTAVISATEWNNFFNLRCNPMAQPEIQKIAYMMRDAYEKSKPRNFSNLNGAWNWHLPYITDETQKQVLDIIDKENFKFDRTGEFNAHLLDKLIKVSIGRCARVSYLNHGENNTPDKDIELCERLISSKHMSPTEHVAIPIKNTEFLGNFRGWKSYRKFIPNESGE